MKMKCLIRVLLIISCLPSCLCWSQEELDLFDLVEEINENFYDVLQVSQDASTAEIRRSYRQLSLRYHPDKNDDPNAAEVFRKIGAVAEVLRDDEKRQMYNDILINGLPDWRQPIYYYRRVRKMSVLELTILLLTIATIGQFLYGWAQYIEKQLVLYELRQRKEKKDRKSKGRKTSSMQLEAELLYYEAMAKAVLPHYKKLLPFVLVKKSFSLIVGVIFYSWRLYHLWKNAERKKETPEDTPVEIKDDTSRISASLTKQNIKKKEKSLDNSEQDGELEFNDTLPSNDHNDEANLNPETSNIISITTCPLSNGQTDTHHHDVNAVSISESVEIEKQLKQSELAKEEEKLQEELMQLEEEIEEDWEKGRKSKTKRTKKPHSTKVKSPLADKSLEVAQYKTQPAATEAIPNKNIYPADEVDRSQTEAIPSEVQAPELSTEAVNQTGSHWSQYQQKQLEWALTQYGKDIHDRWEVIAKAVPNKSKDECIARYKELVELVRKKKSQ